MTALEPALPELRIMEGASDEGSSCFFGLRYTEGAEVTLLIGVINIASG